jgi:hypothetical protein
MSDDPEKLFIGDVVRFTGGHHEMYIVSGVQSTGVFVIDKQGDQTGPHNVHRLEKFTIDQLLITRTALALEKVLPVLDELNKLMIQTNQLLTELNDRWKRAE